MFGTLWSCRLRGRYRAALVLSSAILLACIVLFTNAWRDFGYLTRPIWDSDPDILTVVNQYARPAGMPPSVWCRMHGWEQRSLSVRVFDVVIFSVELDIFELRLQELWDVVDVFVVVESNTTFMGWAKNTTFADNRDRFAWAASKIFYRHVPGRSLAPGESPFAIEGEMRLAVNGAITSAGARAGDLIIAADVDEIPRASTISLLRTCTSWGKAIHLEMRTYMFSFVYPTEPAMWRASVREHGTTRYSHGRISSVMLADSGWHCSFCFRYLSDFKFKMRAYSHADRANRAYLLTDEHIQKSVCSGTDIFDMLPESYDYLDLFKRMRPIPESASYMDLPKGLVANHTHYAFLLPGGCRREP